MTLESVCTITSGKTPCLRVSSTCFYLDLSLSLEKDSPVFRIESYFVLGPVVGIRNLTCSARTWDLVGETKEF